MSKPHIHAQSSVKKFGGQVEDYMPIHEFLDSSKAIVADNRHRLFTHNSWFITVVIPKVFGETIVNADGKTISTRDVAEQHVLEDYHNRFIPSAQDFLDELTIQPWMMNGMNLPPSVKKLVEAQAKTPLVIQAKNLED